MKLSARFRRSRSPMSMQRSPTTSTTWRRSRQRCWQNGLKRRSSAERIHLGLIPASLAAGLRRRKIDVTTTAEAGLIGAEDAAQLSLAAASGRVLITRDADFLRLHASGVSHAGIVYCPQGSGGTGEMLRRLVLIHDLLAPEEMVGRVEFL